MPVRLRRHVRVPLANLDMQCPPRDPPLQQLRAHFGQFLPPRSRVDPGRMVLAVADWVELEQHARWYARAAFPNRREQAAWLADWTRSRKPLCSPSLKPGEALYLN